jgi:hypothetical protein
MQFWQPCICETGAKKTEGTAFDSGLDFYYTHKGLVGSNVP